MANEFYSDKEQADKLLFAILDNIESHISELKKELSVEKDRASALSDRIIKLEMLAGNLKEELSIVVLSSNRIPGMIRWMSAAGKQMRVFKKTMVAMFVLLSTGLLFVAEETNTLGKLYYFFADIVSKFVSKIF